MLAAENACRAPDDTLTMLTSADAAERSGRREGTGKRAALVERSGRRDCGSGAVVARSGSVGCSLEDARRGTVAGNGGSRAIGTFPCAGGLDADG